jgi:hypothetical protein
MSRVKSSANGTTTPLFERLRGWRPTIPHGSLRPWKRTLEILIAGLFVVLAALQLTNGWDDIENRAEDHLRLIGILVGFPLLLAAIHEIDWNRFWNYLTTRKSNQVAIALVIVTASLAIIAARVEEKRDLETATIFLFIGLMSAWFAKAVLELKDNALYIAILLAPLITYLALSGRLSVVELPGGGKVEFEKIAQTQIQAGAATVLLPAKSARGSGTAECGTFKTVGAGEIEFTAPGAGEVTFAIPSQLAARISVPGLQSYLQRYPVLRYFVIVNPNCQLVAFGRVDVLKGILDTNGEGFLQDASRGQFTFLQKYPGLSNASIQGNPTVAEAIDALDSQHVDAIAVVGNEVGRFNGIIDRDQVVNQVLLTVLGAPTRTPTATPTETAVPIPTRTAIPRGAPSAVST